MWAIVAPILSFCLGSGYWIHKESYGICYHIRIGLTGGAVMSEACQPGNQGWTNVDDFSQILKLNKSFLLGKISATAYQQGPIDHETSSLVPDLIGLHDHRILTHSSQPYHREVGRKGQGYSEKLQRPYLS
jgi:hypothetical protein